MRSDISMPLRVFSKHHLMIRFVLLFVSTVHSGWLIGSKKRNLSHAMVNVSLEKSDSVKSYVMSMEMISVNPGSVLTDTLQFQIK